MKGPRFAKAVHACVFRSLRPDEASCWMIRMKSTRSFMFLICPIMVLIFLYYSSGRLHLRTSVQKSREYECFIFFFFEELKTTSSTCLDIPSNPEHLDYLGFHNTNYGRKFSCYLEFNGTCGDTIPFGKTTPG